MRVVVIGATGHVGSYVVPRLIDEGHDVAVISRAVSTPYTPGPAWAEVDRVVVDREASERDGTFGDAVLRLEPDVVIDLICFTPASAETLVDALRGRVSHFLHCGTIFVNGHAVTVPIRETDPRNPVGEYGINKARIESYLLDQVERHGFPATVLHPGHVVGTGWWPLNPAGNVSPDVFSRLARGEELVLPHLGLETLHHVHADDVAQAFVNAMRKGDAVVGESYYIVSEAAVTFRGYAEAIAEWFGVSPNLRFVPWEIWSQTARETDRSATWEHLIRSPQHSIAKARAELDYAPRYTSLAAVEESLAWMIEHDGFAEAERSASLSESNG
jgi:nucleoside-diphosphate-sugar epimerase